MPHWAWVRLFIFYSALFEIAVIAVARAKCNAALCGALPLPPSLTAVRAELPYTNIYSAGARRQFWRIHWQSHSELHL